MADDLERKKRPGLEKIAKKIGIPEPEKMAEGGLRSAIRIRRRFLEATGHLEEEESDDE